MPTNDEDFEVVDTRKQPYPLREAFPEVIPGVGEWAGSKGPLEGNITVTREGLRRLLAIAFDHWELAFACYTQGQPMAMHAERLKRNSLAAALNTSAAVWCEGKLIMSRLFVDAEGQPIVNDCAEDINDLEENENADE